MMMKSSIAIVEDDPVIRNGLQDYLELEDFCEHVWSAGSMEQFFELLPQMPCPDVVLTDIGLPGMSGTDGIRLIREKVRNIDIIMLTVFKDENRIFKSLCAGATGYLLKGTPFSEIRDAILLIRNGGSFMSPSIARKVVAYFNPTQRRQEDNLTPREQQIVQGLVEGLSYKMVADRLGISIDTIRYHIKRIYAKLEVNSKIELINKASR